MLICGMHKTRGLSSVGFAATRTCISVANVCGRIEEMEKQVSTPCMKVLPLPLSAGWLWDFQFHLDYVYVQSCTCFVTEAAYIVKRRHVRVASVPGLNALRCILILRGEGNI